MTFRSSVLYAGKILFSRGSSSSSNGKRSLLGALLCIGISLVPLIAVLVVSNGMIEGITGRMISLSSQDLSVYVDPDSDLCESASSLTAFAEELSTIEGVTGAFPEVRGTALAAGKNYRTGATVRALPSDIFTKSKGFASLFNFVQGEADLSQPKNAIIGEKISSLLGVKAGDTIRLITVRKTASGISPKMTSLKVTGIVSCGYQELDALWVFVPLETGFTALSGSNTEFTVGLSTDQTFSPLLREIEAKVQSFLIEKSGGIISDAWVSHWSELNASEYENFSSTRILLLLIMLLIVLVASVNISSALVMLVMERKREIAILKSVGATPSGITTTFLLTGFATGAGGVLVGLPLGLLASVNINAIIRFMEKCVNFIAKCIFILKNSGGTFSEIHLLDPGYYLQEIPVSIPFGELTVIVLGTLFLSFAVSAIPAIRAGREKPLDTLRKM